MKKKFKKYDMNSNSSYNWGTGSEADMIRTLNSEELSVSVKNSDGSDYDFTTTLNFG